MKVKKVVRESDLGNNRYNEIAEAYREPGTLVWGNLYDLSTKKPFHAGGYFGHAETIADALKIVENHDDEHENAIQILIATCAKYGRHLSYNKAKQEYVKRDGAFKLTHPAHIDNIMTPMLRILQVLLNSEIWYQYSKTLPIGNNDRYQAEEQAYSWSSTVSRMHFGQVNGVPGKLTKFIEKLPLENGFDFSQSNPMFQGD